MLWFKLLQNTTYCGKLKFTAYQLYQRVRRRDLNNERWKVAARRRKIKIIFHPSALILHPFTSGPMRMNISGEEA
jgi:hypothetical protein